MDGVTILNTMATPIMGFQWTTGATVVLITFVIMATIVMMLAWKNRCPEVAIVILPMLILFGGLMVGAVGETQIGTSYKYEVMIDDTVSLMEFNERYQIIEQRGNIYVVKDRLE